jgi:hypothetical protein
VAEADHGHVPAEIDQLPRATASPAALWQTRTLSSQKPFTLGLSICSM